MRIYHTANYDEMSLKAAQIISAQITMKPDCVLGLATGSTPIGTYKELTRQYEAGLLDFSQVKAANLDEYRDLPKDNDQSYAYFMRENLFKHVNILPENTNIPNGTQTDVDVECERYEKVIAQLGGVDLQLLGLGRNGHIGFNEPSDEFPKMTHCVNLTQSTIDANKRFFEKEEDVPRQAYTMGIGTIMKARKILLIVNGSSKREALHRALYGPITPQVPASILQLHPDVIVVADADAWG